MRSTHRYLQTTLRPKLQVDLGLTLWPLRRGTGDPSMRAERAGVWWRATRTPACSARMEGSPVPRRRGHKVSPRST